MPHWNSESEYFEKNFNKLDLSSSSTEHAAFEEGAFNHCNFTSACLSHCKFTHCTFNHCNFSLAEIVGSLFHNTDLRAADFTDSWDFHLDVMNNLVAKAKFPRLEALSLLESLGIELVD